MWKKNTEKVLKIMTGVDGGCNCCVGKLFNLLIREFPEFVKFAEDILQGGFGEEPGKVGIFK